ncbi:hypothetical protein TNCV_2602471 [Trichonephila clavipes]|nr:hypothetical protein TNCV_2602471 [Trichonephila clavipes]
MDSTDLDILSKLVRLRQRKQVRFQWIPSHVGVPGNKVVDELAGRGQKRVKAVGGRRCFSTKESKSIASAGKIISSVFWEAKGILLIDYLEKSKPITSEYNSNPLHQLDAKICEKRPALKKKKTSFFRTTQLCKKVSSRWENCEMQGTICSVIPLNAMIWHPQLSIKGLILYRNDTSYELKHEQ